MKPSLSATSLLIAVAIIAQAGCAPSALPDARPDPGQTSVRRGPPPIPMPTGGVWEEVTQFEWGRAVIRVGMTKEEVLAQIEKSGLREWNGEFGIRKPPAEMAIGNVWELPCGTSSGAAPGYAAVRLTFREGKVTKVENFLGPLPA